MWVFLNDAFFSIVDEKAKQAKFGVKPAKRKINDRDILVVRARRKGDIERVFSQHMKLYDRKLEVTESAVTDYQFRARIPRGVVKEVMVAEVQRITYGNFKDSVAEDDLHHAYSSVWGVMYRLQEPPARRTYGPGLFDGAAV